MSDWTDDRVELLKSLWAEGLSAAQIARQLTGVSRNAVISKIHRVGSSGRAVASKPTRVPPPRRIAPLRPVLKISARNQVFEEPEARAPTVVIPFREEAPGTRTVMTVRPFECRWPMASDGEGSLTFCGEGCEGSWCEEHRLRVFQPSDASPAKRRHDLARALRRYV